jgi:hypothetical protein
VIPILEKGLTICKVSVTSEGTIESDHNTEYAEVVTKPRHLLIAGFDSNILNISSCIILKQY